MTEHLFLLAFNKNGRPAQGASNRESFSTDLAFRECVSGCITF